jgi:hypothetical protein
VRVNGTVHRTRHGTADAETLVRTLLTRIPDSH